MYLEKQELINITGGATSIGTIINSITKIATLILDLGRLVGSSFRYTQGKYMCK